MTMLALYVLFLPQALRRKGASYKIAPLQWGRYSLSVECIVRDAGSFTMRLGCLTKENQPVQQWEWQGRWGEGRKIILPQLMATS